MLSMKAKYALRALIFLARSSDKLHQIKNISQECDIPYKFLETIMQELRNHGILASKRGIFGGYYLAKEPIEISVGAVIRFIDGPLAPIRCASVTAYQKCDDCKDEKTCEIRKIMIDVRNSISNVLDSKTLHEIAELDFHRVDYLSYFI
ncbi:MAG: Rrf2 family transcriptional regulator [Rickettsiales bacterium]|nr:Rrf2 family transcriptional regulator [Rickettsiales bacterium]